MLSMIACCYETNISPTPWQRFVRSHLLETRGPRGADPITRVISPVICVQKSHEPPGTTQKEPRLRARYGRGVSLRNGSVFGAFGWKVPEG